MFDTGGDYLQMAKWFIKDGSYTPEAVRDECVYKWTQHYCEVNEEIECDDVARMYWESFDYVMKEAKNPKSFIGKAVARLKYRKEAETVMDEPVFPFFPMPESPVVEYEMIENSPIGEIVKDKDGKLFVLVSKDLAEIVFEQTKYVLDAEYRKEELLPKIEFKTMIPVGTPEAKVFYGVREEDENDVYYVLQEISVSGEYLYRILLVVDNYEEFELPELETFDAECDHEWETKTWNCSKDFCPAVNYEGELWKDAVSGKKGVNAHEHEWEPVEWYCAKCDEHDNIWDAETFEAPEGVCLFCDETEDLETVNLDGWPEEICEHCLDPNNWMAESYEIDSKLTEAYKKAYKNLKNAGWEIQEEAYTVGAVESGITEIHTWHIWSPETPSKLYRAEDREESERMTRAEAEVLAEKMTDLLEPYCEFVEICGSYRRGREDPGDLDIVIIPKEGETLPEIVEKIAGYYEKYNWIGEKKTQLLVDGVKVDIKVSSLTGLGAALLYFTGPAGYNIGMRRSAKSKGMKLNEYGIWDRDTNEYLGGATEEEIYGVLGKTFRPPEERGAESFAAEHPSVANQTKKEYNIMLNKLTELIGEKKLDILLYKDEDESEDELSETEEYSIMWDKLGDLIGNKALDILLGRTQPSYDWYDLDAESFSAEEIRVCANCGSDYEKSQWGGRKSLCEVCCYCRECDRDFHCKDGCCEWYANAPEDEQYSRYKAESLEGKKCPTCYLCGIDFSLDKCRDCGRYCCTEKGHNWEVYTFTPYHGGDCQCPDCLYRATTETGRVCEPCYRKNWEPYEEEEEDEYAWDESCRDCGESLLEDVIRCDKCELQGIALCEECCETNPYRDGTLEFPKEGWARRLTKRWKDAIKLGWIDENGNLIHDAESFFAEHSYNEYMVEMRSSRGDLMWSSPCPDYDYLVKEISHMLKTPYYAIDVFTTEHGRRVHMATIKYGKVESGPLAKELAKSLDMDSYGAEDEYEDERRWTDSELFAEWLKDEDMVFHQLTARMFYGPNFGAFKDIAKRRAGTTRRLLKIENFHIFETVIPEIMESDFYPLEMKAEEGLEAMSQEIAAYLLNYVKKAANDLLMGDWLDEGMTVAVDLSNKVDEDDIYLIFPDNSDMKLIPYQREVSFVYDPQIEAAVLEWKTGLKVVEVDGVGFS